MGSMIKADRVHMKGKISLAKLVVNDLEDCSGVKNSFELVRLDHKKKKYIICAKSSGAKGISEKQSWMHAIKKQAIIQRMLLDKDLKMKRKKKFGNLNKELFR